MLGLVLAALLLLDLFGSLPRWQYSRNYGAIIPAEDWD
jgi:hypothetical protein